MQPGDQRRQRGSAWGRLTTRSRRRQQQQHCWSQWRNKSGLLQLSFESRYITSLCIWPDALLRSQNMDTPHLASVGLKYITWALWTEKSVSWCFRFSQHTVYNRRVWKRWWGYIIMILHSGDLRSIIVKTHTYIYILFNFNVNSYSDILLFI